MGTIEGEAVAILRIPPDRGDLVLAAGHLFDREPRSEATDRFLAADTHHLLIAYDGRTSVGFVSGIEVWHPDKGAEMLLYELGVAESYRRRGIGTRLVRALAALAKDRGCYGMWVPTEADESPATATYQAAGAGDPEPAAIQTWIFSPER